MTKEDADWNDNVNRLLSSVHESSRFIGTGLVEDMDVLWTVHDDPCEEVRAGVAARHPRWWEMRDDPSEKVRNEAAKRASTKEEAEYFVKDKSYLVSGTAAIRLHSGIINVDLSRHPISYIRAVIKDAPGMKSFNIVEQTNNGWSSVGVEILPGRTVFSDFASETNNVTACLRVKDAADHRVACSIISSMDMSKDDELRDIWANQYRHPYSLIAIIKPNEHYQPFDAVGEYSVMTASKYKQKLADYTVAAVSAMGDHLSVI